MHINVNYAINIIHEKAVRSDLSTQFSNFPFFNIIYLSLVALLGFSMIFTFFLRVDVN